ncbi:MAG: S26 family signal peptidase [Myxococcales bacterium]|nr:S26 family signal peptidase [Myxococcales bacterium]
MAGAHHEDAWEAALEAQPGLQRDAARPQGIWVTVVSTSMLPTLEPGTRIHVRRRPVHIGDVIVFLTADCTRAVAHRVVFCMPGLPWIVESADCHRDDGAVAAIHRKKLIGVADLPRRPPTPSQCWAALRLMATGLARRSLGFR